MRAPFISERTVNARGSHRKPSNHPSTPPTCSAVAGVYHGSLTGKNGPKSSPIGSVRCDGIIATPTAPGGGKPPLRLTGAADGATGGAEETPVWRLVPPDAGRTLPLLRGLSLPTRGVRGVRGVRGDSLPVPACLPDELRFASAPSDKRLGTTASPLS